MYVFSLNRASILDEPLPQPKVTVSSQSQVWSPALPVTSSSVTGSSFRPFASEPDKQARYEKFLEFSKSGQKGTKCLLNLWFL